MRRLGLLLCGVAATFVAAACSGGLGGGAATPTPTPSATASPPDSCRIVWISENGADPSYWNEFVVDGPVANWVSGTVAYNRNNPVGVFYEHVTPGATDASAAAITTSGTFGLQLANGTTPGGTIAWSDTSGQVFYALDLSNGYVGVAVGSDGTGSFDGVWSSPNTQTSPVPGSGTVRIAWHGSSLEMGTLASYARCYYAGTPAARTSLPGRGAW